jgi:hypothetical protein
LESYKREERESPSPKSEDEYLAPTTIPATPSGRDGCSDR